MSDYFLIAMSVACLAVCLFKCIQCWICSWLIWSIDDLSLKEQSKIIKFLDLLSFERVDTTVKVSDGEGGLVSPLEYYVFMSNRALQGYLWVLLAFFPGLFLLYSICLRSC